MTSSLRKLGRTDLAVSSLCLGGNVFGWTIDEPTSFAVLDAYLARDGNFIDTADSYSTWVPRHVGGESETIIGRWIKARRVRERVVLATKLGSPMPSGEGLGKRHIRQAAEDSLRRLQVDHIDVLYAHRDDPKTPIEETVAAFDALVREGKVRAIAASNFDAERLAASLAFSARERLARYEVLQPNYNAVVRTDFEGPLQALCVKESISVAPYFALAAGFLTGKYKKDGPAPSSARAGGVQSRYANPHGWAVLDAVMQVAKERRVRPAHVALSWLAAQPSIAAPIASATSVAQLNELLDFTSVTLRADELSALDVRPAP